MNINLEFFKTCLNPVFVETGTFDGDGVNKAFQVGFQKVISIELSDLFYPRLVDLFKEEKRLTLVHGNSGDILYETIKYIETPITFFLDGHYSSGDTARGDEISPLMKELKQIELWRKEKSAIILIDDMRCWGHPRAKEVYGFDTSDILEALKGWNISYIDGYIANDILVAKI